MSVRLRGRGEGNEATSEGPGGVAAAAAGKAGDAAAVERFVAQARFEADEIAQVPEEPKVDSA